MILAKIHRELKAFLHSRRGNLVIKWARWVFMAGIIGVLAYQFTRIGWGDIWRALPTNPVFYLIFIVMYCSLPLTETVIYRKIWDFPFFRGLPTFLKKRVYNKDVLNYSGEVFLYLWAKKIGVVRSKRVVLQAIKDNNILSTIASTLIAVGLLGFFLLTDQVMLPVYVRDQLGIKIAAILLVVFGLGALGIRFRRSLFSLPGRMLTTIFLIHVSRLIVVNVLQVLQWAIVLHDVSLTILFTFLAMQIITSRIPFLPARDLIFIGASVELTGYMNVSSVNVAGMLLVISVLDKGLNFLLYIVTTYWERRDRPAGPNGETVAGEEKDLKISGIQTAEASNKEPNM